MVRAQIFGVALLLSPALAHAQFSATAVTDSGFAMIVVGDIVRTSEAPPIEGGDEIGAFFGDQLVGFVELSVSDATAARNPGVRIFGDNPNTDEVEGPALGEIVTFRYYDLSTNTTISDVQALNEASEPTNFDWQGIEVLNIPGLPIDVTPSEVVGLRIGSGTIDNDGNNGGDGGSTPTGNPDVDGDGTITSRDAAMVLRVVIGGSRNLDTATIGRADVDGDGTVSTADAIAVYKAM